MPWVVESDTEQILRGILTEDPSHLPPSEYHLGATTVRWWDGKAGEAVVMAEGGSPEDRLIGEQIVTAQLMANGYKRAQFTFASPFRFKTAGWPDIMAKAKRLIQSANVVILRNGYNNIIGHVTGDHGEYNTEIGRDDPESRTITTWQCECPWDQYAWQRTRKWKKYEGRPCAHVMALYWKSLSTPLDDYDPDQHGPADPGQAQGMPPTPAGPPAPSAPSGPLEGPTPVEAPSPAMTGGPPMAPPGDPGILPTPPMDQMAQQMPPIPGQTPAGMPANPAIVSVPGAKPPSPFNPIQYPGGTYSRMWYTGADEFTAPEIVRLKNDAYGLAEGKSEAHGAGQYQPVPAGSSGEVLAQDSTTGWVEVIFPLDGGPMTPYHVRCFVDPSDLIHSTQSPPGPFIKRR